jgi:hypothetical protein
MHFNHATLLLLAMIAVTCLHAQTMPQQADDSIVLTQTVSPKYTDKISRRASRIEAKLDKQAAKALSKWKKEEERIKNKLARNDSSMAQQLFGDAAGRYKALEQRLQNGQSAQQYIPTLDTLRSSLKFLQEHPELLAKTKQVKEKLVTAMSKTTGLSDKFQQAEEVRKFLVERKQYLKQQLAKLGAGSYRYAKNLKQLNKQAYYYGEQVREYKSLLKDHKKAERKALELLAKTKLFKDFMRKNSQLASMFRLPGGPDLPQTPSGGGGLPGLQTRAQVNNLIQQQIASGGPNAMAQVQQNMQEAQSQLNALKGKILKAGGNGSSDADMPEGFMPNGQKTKSFLKRIQVGANIQSKKSRGYFPATSDIGLSLGYKLNDRSIIGIGTSYKLGLGKDIRHMKISHQGISLRSFVDWKIKGSFWVSGGYELNYQPDLMNVPGSSPSGGGWEVAYSWQRSGLIGLSKVVSLKTKVLKQTKLQLLWDFLSYGQRPRTQAVMFRIGYTF